MNAYTAATVINLGIILMVTVGMFITQNAFPLLGLFFMVGTRTNKEETKE